MLVDQDSEHWGWLVSILNSWLLAMDTEFCTSFFSANPSSAFSSKQASTIPLCRTQCWNQQLYTKSYTSDICKLRLETSKDYTRMCIKCKAAIKLLLPLWKWKLSYWAWLHCILSYSIRLQIHRPPSLHTANHTSLPNLSFSAGFSFSKHNYLHRHTLEVLHLDPRHVTCTYSHIKSHYSKIAVTL